MPDFWIKQNDLRPNLVAVLEDEDNNAVDLRGASSVDFHMESYFSDTPKVDAAAKITDDVNGEVEYDWSDGDTDTSGRFSGEFEVKWQDGDPETYPNHDDIEIKVRREVA